MNMLIIVSLLRICQTSFNSQHCVVCLDRKPNVRYVPCHHVVICRECDDPKQTLLNTCSVCQEKVQDRQILREAEKKALRRKIQRQSRREKDLKTNMDSRVIQEERDKEIKNKLAEEMIYKAMFSSLEYSERLELLEQAFDLNPGDLNYWFAKVHIFHDQESREYIQLLETAVGLYPRVRFFHLQLAHKMLFEAENYAYAAELLEHAKKCPEIETSFKYHNPWSDKAQESFLNGYLQQHYYNKLGVARRYFETASKQYNHVTFQKSKSVLSALYIVHTSLRTIYEAHEDKDRSLMNQKIVDELERQLL